MEQLVMRWTNDGSPAVMPQVPEGLGLTALPEMKDGVEQWLDVVQYGLSEGRQGREYYDTVMVGRENYDAQYCYLITDGDRAPQPLPSSSTTQKPTGISIWSPAGRSTADAASARI